MAAALLTVAGAGIVTVTGTGFVGTETSLAMTFTAADNKRRLLEVYRVPVVAGVVSVVLKMPFTSGTVVVKAVDSQAALLATAINLGV